MRKENKTTVECRCVEVEGTFYFSSDQQSFWVIRTGSQSVFGGFRVCHLFNFLCRVPSVAYFSELYILDWPFCFLLRLFCSVFDNCRIPCIHSLVVAWGRGLVLNIILCIRNIAKDGRRPVKQQMATIPFISKYLVIYC